MKSYFLFILFSLATICTFSQKKDISLKEYFTDAEFFFVAEEFLDALQDYLEVYKRGYNNNANINYRIGICYLNIPGQKEKSVEYLKKACENASSKFNVSSLNEEYAPLDAWLYLGNAYRILYELDEAIETYNIFLDLNPEQAEEEKKYALKQIEAAQIANEFFNDPKLVRFNNLGSLINNSSPNHNCLVSGDGSTMIFMTKLPFYEAIYMSVKRGNNWSRPVNITPQLMSDGDQIATGLSYDGKSLLLAKEDIFDSDIYISHFENGKWAKSKSINKTINSRYWESHASFSKDGNTIYFTSNRRGGFGEMDIYSVSKINEKEWGQPVNLGKNINTELSEDTPFITEDGNSLYFSSQGHITMGGYDYFVSHYTDTGWGGAENLNYPLCSTDDDLFYYPYNNGNYAYIHKILDEGSGHWDIYQVEFPDEDQLEKAISDQIEEAFIEEEELQQIVENPDINTFLIRPVLFGFDAYSLSGLMKESVDRYADLLTNYPMLNIKIIGHTDALGSTVYNQRLSERRALAVKEYLISKGISKERITAIGMGESHFIATNKSENGTDNPEGRKYNRRAEFNVIGSDESISYVLDLNFVPDSIKIK